MHALFCLQNKHARPLLLAKQAYMPCFACKTSVHALLCLQNKHARPVLQAKQVRHTNGIAKQAHHANGIAKQQAGTVACPIQNKPAKQSPFAKQACLGNIYMLLS